MDIVPAFYRINGKNLHFGKASDDHKLLADLEMTNRYVNDLLNRLGHKERVSIDRHLGYRRVRCYLGLDPPGRVVSVIPLIMSWPLYSLWGRLYFTTRFVTKIMCGYISRGLDRVMN